MGKQNQPTLAFNRGILDDLGLARVDLARYKMAASIMKNWICRVLGSMSIRPGMAYLLSTKNNLKAKCLPFVFSAQDTARIEITRTTLRVLISDALVTRPAVTAAVANGTFVGSLAGWTVSDELGGASTWNAGGFAQLKGNGTANAILDQTVVINEPGVEHALRIVITRGPINFRIGTSAGDDSVFHETYLGEGIHSLAFTPGGANVYLRFQNSSSAAAYLTQCTIEAAGVMEITSPWTNDSDIANIRSTQSADVTWVACPGYQQRKIERRSLHSWSVVLYQPTNGPFRVLNVTPITLTPSALVGDIHVTSSKPLFKQSQVGALFRIASVGQRTQVIATADNSFSDPIRVNGVGAQRAFGYVVTGVFAGKVTLQVSAGAPGVWSDVLNTTVPANVPAYNDTFDNQVMYYRIGIKTGDYTSGTATCTLNFAAGSITGVVRVRGWNSATDVSCSVLQALGNTTESADWWEGAWSDYRGWPQAVRLHEGRLGWFGSTMYLSVSDDYENFDDTIEGAAAPISRSIGEGAIGNIYWALSLQRMLVGTASSESSARSSSLDEPLTTTNFVIRPSSTEGSANVDAVRVDKLGLFVQASTTRLFQLDIDYYTYDYKSEDLNLMNPTLNAAGIVQIAVQRKPDTRIHCRRADGTVGILVFDRLENVIAWQNFDTPGGFGIVEDISVLPGTTEDQVYYVVARNLPAGQTLRFHEKWAKESECTGMPVAKLSDSHVVYSGAAVSIIPGLANMEGLSVVAWGYDTTHPYIDGNGNTVGRDLGTYTVQGGQITGLPFPVTDAVIGLPYSAPWQSMKQAFAAAMGTPLNQMKRIDSMGMILKNTHAQGLKTGVDFDHMDDIALSDLPVTAASLGTSAEVADENAILNSFEQQMGGVDDLWSTDTRVCLLAASPRPCTVLAFTVSMDTQG